MELSLKSTVVPGPAALKGGSLIFQPCKHLVSDMPTYKVQNYSPPAHIIATVPFGINSYSLHSPACFVNRQRTQAPLEFTGHGSSSRLFRKKTFDFARVLIDLNKRKFSFRNLNYENTNKVP